jgi:hypothetical protein
MRMRWLDIFARNPDVGVAIPAVIAGMPDPVVVFMRRWWDNLVRRRWRTDGDMHLGTCDPYRKYEGAGDNKKVFSHETSLLELLQNRTPVWGEKL